MTSYDQYNDLNYTDIPMLQRDYVQGADVNAEKRDNFLDSIFKSLADNDFEQGKMDFIYGSSFSDGGDRKGFLPIDGQQRLTTLSLIGWLLHQKSAAATESADGSSSADTPVVADAAGAHDSADAPAATDSADAPRPAYKLPDICYRTRHTTEQFFHRLMKYSLPADYGNDIRKHLQDEPIWMAKRWLADPSINSMLDLLAAADHKLAEAPYRDKIGLMARRFFAASPLQFEQLDMEDYGLTEDLYIKMNARGKLLTPFENWKAEFIGMINKYYSSIPYTFTQVDGQTYSIPEYFTYAIEHEWTDLLWPEVYTAWKSLSDEKRKETPYPQIDSTFLNILDFVTKALFYSQNPAGKDEEGGDAQRFGGKDDTLLPKRRVELYLPLTTNHVDSDRLPDNDTIAGSQGVQNVVFLFNVLDTLCHLFKGKDTDSFFNDLLYNGEWDATSNRVNLFNDKSVNLYALCLNRSLAIPTELLLIGILKYCIKYPAEDAADKQLLLKYIRVLWGWIISHRMRRESGYLYVDLLVRVAHYPDLMEVAELLCADPDVDVALARIQSAPSDSNSKKLLAKELDRFSFRPTFGPYFDIMIGCEDLKGDFSNLYLAANSAKADPKGFFDRFKAFYEADSWQKARWLLEHGWLGMDDIWETCSFYGKKGHWDYIFTIEKDKECRDNLREALAGYLNGATPIALSQDKKEYYIHRYKSFFNAHRWEENPSHLYYAISDFNITMLLSSFSFHSPHIRQCPYAHAAAEELRATDAEAVKDLLIYEDYGSKETVPSYHGCVRLNCRWINGEWRPGQYWLESVDEGWQFNFAKGNRKMWHDKWATRFQPASTPWKDTNWSEATWTDNQGEFTITPVDDAPAGTHLLHPLPDEDRIQTLNRFLRALHSLL